jgi:hypothetical protein
MNNTENNFSIPVASYQIALDVVEYMNIRYPDMIYFIKELDNKYQVVYKKKIIIKI